MNKAVLGHRTAQGWVIDATGVVTGNVRSDTYYDMQVVVNGLVVTVLVNGAHVLSKQLAPRWIDGQPYGLNMGLVGVGSNNSRGTYDNVTVQALPPQTSLREHRGLRRRRRRPLHRREHGHVGGQRRTAHRHAVRRARPATTS